MTLAEGVYKITIDFPKHELYGLTSQLRRAAVSIPSNIAEGQARNSTGEFIQFLGIARGSLAELETQLELAARLGFLSDDEKAKALNLHAEVGRMLSGLISKLRTTSH